MENTEIIDKIKSSIECTICFEKFIKLSYERLCIFYEDNKKPNTTLTKHKTKDNSSFLWSPTEPRKRPLRHYVKVEALDRAIV